VTINKNKYKKLKQKINYIKKNKDLYKYDFVGICLRYFKIPISFKNKYVCSQFVAELLETTDIHKFNKKTYFVEPKDFEKVEIFNLIYSGKYLFYR